MEPSYVLLFVIFWLVSGLVVTYWRASDEGWVDGGDVAVMFAFGPITFLMVLWFFVQDHTMRLYRRARRWVVAKDHPVRLKLEGL